MTKSFDFDPSYKHPFSMIVSGTSGSGKTVFTMGLLSGDTEVGVCPEIDRVYWFYGEWQEKYATAPKHFTFIPGLPANLEEHIGEDRSETKVVVFDDLMLEASDSVMVAEAFTQKRHHHNLSVILITQNVYVQGKQMRNIHNNAQYLVFFKNPRDQQQFSRVVSQLEYGRTSSKEVVKSYQDAVSVPYGHLTVDLHGETPDHLKYRSRTLNHVQYVYN